MSVFGPLTTASAEEADIWRRRPTSATDPNVWTGCWSQSRLLQDNGSRRYVSGLFDRLTRPGRLIFRRSAMPSLSRVRRFGRWEHSTRRMISSFSEAG